MTRVIYDTKWREEREKVNRAGHIKFVDAFDDPIYHAIHHPPQFPVKNGSERKKMKISSQRGFFFLISSLRFCDSVLCSGADDDEDAEKRIIGYTNISIYLMLPTRFQAASYLIDVLWAHSHARTHKPS